MARLRDWLVAAAVLLVGRRRPPATPPVARRIVPAGAPDRRAETAVVVLLLAVAACAIGFIVVYALDRVPHQTQFLGLAIGLAFAALAAASILIGKRLVAEEELEEDYPGQGDEDAQRDVAQIVEESGSRFTRKRLLMLAGGGAAGALGLALITPAVSLGPVFDMDPFYETPWRRGRRLVDGNGRPYRASDIQEDIFYTAFPEGADPESVAAPLIVVRLDPAQLRLPSERTNWAPGGILAYSKICTHAGCAIALYRSPLFPPVEPKPAFVCPCHYSTFDPASGGTVLFGPAGRALPQLPLEVDAGGGLRAAGNFSGPIGPSWWGVRMKDAR